MATNENEISEVLSARMDQERKRLKLVDGDEGKEEFKLNFKNACIINVEQMDKDEHV